MKEFEIPEIQIIEFMIEDVITTSGFEDEFPMA